jgi:hypothetical protein
MVEFKLTVPIWMHFSCNRFGESFHSKLAGVVVGVSWEPNQSSKGRNVENQSTPMVFSLTHDFNSTHSDSGCAEEQSFHLLMRLFLSCRLGVTRERIAGIVNHDIEMVVVAEMLGGGSEGGINRSY